MNNVRIISYCLGVLMNRKWSLFVRDRKSTWYRDYMKSNEAASRFDWIIFRFHNQVFILCKWYTPFAIFSFKSWFFFFLIFFSREKRAGIFLVPRLFSFFFSPAEKERERMLVNHWSVEAKRTLECWLLRTLICQLLVTIYPCNHSLLQELSQVTFDQKPRSEHE